MSKLKSLCCGACDPQSTCAQAAYALFRLFFGAAMASHAIPGKLPPPGGFVDKLAGMSIPFPLVSAWAAGLAEGVGGILIAIGLLTRPSAIAVAITMAVAAFIAHAPDDFATKEKALLYLFGMILIAAMGSGRFGLDRGLRGK